MHSRSSLKAFPFPSQVPLLPFLPVASLFINVYLMMQLDRGTWMRFAIWMALGTSNIWPTDVAAQFLSFPSACFRKGGHYFNCAFPGFLIYFTYGIRNSSEAPRSGRPVCTIKGEPTATEKAAFLRDTQTITLDDDEDS